MINKIAGGVKSRTIRWNVPAAILFMGAAAAAIMQVQGVPESLVPILASMVAIRTVWIRLNPNPVPELDGWAKDDNQE